MPSTTTMNSSKSSHKKRATRSDLGPVANESVAKTPKTSRSEKAVEPLSPSREGSSSGGRPSAIATPTKADEGQKRGALQDEENKEERAEPPPTSWTCEDCHEVFPVEIRLRRHQSKHHSSPPLLYLFLFSSPPPPPPPAERVPWSSPTRTPVLRRVYPVTAAAVAGRATTETTRVTTLASAPSPSPVTAAAAAERFTNKFTHELAIEFTSSVCYKFSY